jgi:hypothetical protein
MSSLEEFHNLYYKHDIQNYSLLSGERLYGLYQAICEAVEEEIPGDVVECGSAKGGSAALMGLTLKTLGDKRILRVCDTFEGIPVPTEEDGPGAEAYVGQFKGDLEEIMGLFTSLGLMGQTKLVKGMFQDTIEKRVKGPIAVLHLDGDWYESTKCCLEVLYDRVSPGGFIQIDDYGHWPGCRKAVDEFFQTRGLAPMFEFLDYTGVQFRKEK